MQRRHSTESSRRRRISPPACETAFSSARRARQKKELRLRRGNGARSGSGCDDFRSIVIPCARHPCRAKCDVFRQRLEHRDFESPAPAVCGFSLRPNVDGHERAIYKTRIIGRGLYRKDSDRSMRVECARMPLKRWSIANQINCLSENRPRRGDRHILLPGHRKMSQSPPGSRMGSNCLLKKGTGTSRRRQNFGKFARSLRASPLFQRAAKPRDRPIPGLGCNQCPKRPLSLAAGFFAPRRFDRGDLFHHPAVHVR